ncbi:hypothetical protein ACCS40_36375, partial [Rhizobium ruizarguesonis]
RASRLPDEHLQALRRIYLCPDWSRIAGLRKEHDRQNAQDQFKTPPHDICNPLARPREGACQDGERLIETTGA